jgi:hypothetical protein
VKSYSEHASSPSSGRFCKPSLGDTVKRKKSGTKFSITLCGSTKTHHPLETKIAKELFQSMTVSVFRFSAAQVRWSQPELDQLQSLLTHAYKRAEYLHNGTASDIFVFPKKWGGEELSTHINIIAQELCNNIRRCLPCTPNHKTLTHPGQHRALSIPHVPGTNTRRPLAWASQGSSWLWCTVHSAAESRYLKRLISTGPSVGFSRALTAPSAAALATDSTGDHGKNTPPTTCTSPGARHTHTHSHTHTHTHTHTHVHTEHTEHTHTDTQTHTQTHTHTQNTHTEHSQKCEHAHC